AVAASLGAGLVAMVGALSEGRPKYADHADLYAELVPAARALAATINPGSEAVEEIVEQLELIAEGGRSDYRGFFEPMLYETTAIEHLNPVTLVVLDDGEDGLQALATVSDHEERTRWELEARGSIP
ncbi:MAG TPA: cyclodeaminase/cyclohydrolase family protein, partial [Tepidiformaceae bacterium]|nr:cyclodeaminase/cyclohydrolase family protein [Tepidiformaceae bacterium]